MTITRVTIPIDFSRVAVGAVDIGRWLADRAHTSIELLAVASPRYAAVTTAALNALADDQPGKVTHRVIATQHDDDVEGCLVRDLLDSPDALWCVGSHGRTALGELLFGSVSADLVRDAERPLVVVGPRATARRTAPVLVVALDGSDESEAIVPEALRLAASLGLRLRLLQVGLDEVPNDVDASAYLAGVAEQLPHADRADYDVLYGDAGDQLVAYVNRTDDVAMLAMATRGVPAGARFSVPSTAMQVLRKVEVPVLLLHPAKVADPLADIATPVADERRRVVVGVDSRDASQAALEWAATEAVRREAILQVVHTWSIPVGPGAMYGYPIWPDIELCRQAALDEVAITASDLGGQHPGLIIETIVAEGDAGHVLDEQSVGAELLVVGRHRHGRLARMLLGSTSNEVVRHAACPLVVVPCDSAD